MKKSRIFAEDDIQAACEEVMSLVGRVAGLKLSQVIRFLAEEQSDEVAALKAALVASRSSLIGCGFVGAGEHGPGDPEINLIDAALTPA